MANLSLEYMKLYWLTNICLTLRSGEQIFGSLDFIDDDNQTVLVSAVSYPLAEIADVEVVGELNYHSYYARREENSHPFHINLGNGAKVFFDFQDFVPGTDYQCLLHKEFKALAACHRVWTDGQFQVADVRLLSVRPYVSISALNKGPYLYVLEDGTTMTGTLQGVPNHLDVQTSTALVPLDPETVRKLVRIPRINEVVDITTLSGRVVSGTVSAANDVMIIVAGQTVQAVRMEDLDYIRYHGATVENNYRPGGTSAPIRMVSLSLGVKGESFTCRLPNFRTPEDEEAAVTGATASFISGVSKDGPIAKDVTVDNIALISQDKERTGLMLVYPKDNAAIGYIGKEFIHTTHKKLTNEPLTKGTVSFRRSQLCFQPNAYNAYVVRYISHGLDSGATASQIEELQAIPKTEFAKVWLDDEDRVHILHPSVSFLEEFLSRPVELLDYDGQRTCGLLEEVTDSAVTVRCGESPVTLERSSICKVYYFGQISTFLSRNPDTDIRTGLGTGSINKRVFYHFNDILNLPEGTDPQVGSYVKFTISYRDTSKKKDKGEDKFSYGCAREIQLLESADCDFIHTGYVLTYIDKAGNDDYGFILPPEELAEHIRSNDKTGNLFFHASVMLNPRQLPIDTMHNYYRVLYMLDLNGNPYNVVFTESFIFNSPVTRQESMALSGLPAPSPELEGKEYRYGLLTKKFKQYAEIHRLYLNGEYYGPSTLDDRDFVQFNPEEARVISHISEALSTSKRIFLVRYVQKGTELNSSDGKHHPAIDYDLPIEVLYTFNRKNIASMQVQEEQVVMDCLQAPQAEVTEQTLSDTDDAPALVSGEGLYVKLEGGAAFYRLFESETDTVIRFTDGANVVKSSIKMLFRFGVITHIDLDAGTGMISNYIPFKLSIAEPIMLNILRNQKEYARLHIMYRQAGNKILEVCRISEQCYQQLPWQSGTVTDHDELRRTITISGNATHFLTVQSQHINPYIKAGPIIGREVFTRQVTHPFQASDSAPRSLAVMALEVRCQEENSPETFAGTGEIIAPQTPAEPEDQGQAALREESLVELLLQAVDLEQHIASITSEADGKQASPQEIGKALEYKSRLAAYKYAEQNPEFTPSNSATLLESELCDRCTVIAQEANGSYSELSFYLATLLRHPRNQRSNTLYQRDDCLYRLFAQDFESREHLLQFVQAKRPASRSQLSALFTKKCEKINELVAHLALLDKISTDTVCQLLLLNEPLCNTITAYANDTRVPLSENGISQVVRSLQEHYHRNRRIFSDTVTKLIEKKSVCEELAKTLNEMQKQFLRMICRDDRGRFTQLLSICNNVTDSMRQPGFAQREQLLLGAYRDIRALTVECLTHPCRESTALLLRKDGVNISNNILTTVSSEILSLLNRLYQAASAPRIHCRINEHTLSPHAGAFQLIIENGAAGDFLQTAENLSITLLSYTEGIAPHQVILPRSRLACGEHLAVEVEFDRTEEIKDVVEIGWSASFQCATGFQESGTPNREELQQVSDRPLQFQFGDGLVNTKNYDAENPYAIPAQGQPLTKANKHMFFGRKLEMAQILEGILDPRDRSRFKPGSAVIIHGQKKSGKTSLVSHLRSYIDEDPTLSDRAIFLDFSNVLMDCGGPKELPYFQQTLYSTIMSRFRNEVKKNHPDVFKMLNDNGLEIPRLYRPEYQISWPTAFDDFFQEFRDLDNGEHSIILFMDEFTLLCTSILARLASNPEDSFLAMLPNIIKTFSQYGFIQIIIGHEAMMRALNQLGVLNHTTEFAQTVNVCALDEVSARELVTKPMIDAFGYNVYATDLGEQAVDRLLDLSGRSPAFLMRLCDRMFRYYTNRSKCPHTQLLLRDVEAMVQEYTGEMTTLDDFDILLREDGDALGALEELATTRYLTKVVHLAHQAYDHRTADVAELTEALKMDGMSEAEIEKTRILLEARGVITISDGGRVKINTWLFAAYIQQKYGLK